MSSNESSDTDSDETYSDYSDEENNGQSDELIACSDEPGSALWNDRLNSIQKFVKETQASSLDLGNRKLRRGEVVSILKLLIDSQVTEIDLQGNNLRNGINRFSRLLVQTKLKKLCVAWCNLSSDDVVHLMESLKDSDITELNISFNRIRFYASAASAFVSHLLRSRVTKLNMEWNYFMREAGAEFTQRLPETSITHLNLCGIMRKNESRNLITSLLQSLQLTVIKDLNLSNNSLKFAELKQLSEILRKSKLQKLSLSCNGISDAGINALTKGLMHSKIVDLDVSDNKIVGHNNLFHHMKYTVIESLDLSKNLITHDEIFNFPEFLNDSSVAVLKLNGCLLRDTVVQKLMKSVKFSKVTKLHLSGSHFGESSISEFHKIVKSTDITDIDFSNSLFGKELSILGDCLEGSKLENIDLSENFEAHQADKNLKFLLEFMEKTKKSTIVSLDLSKNNGIVQSKNVFYKSLENTTFTHLSLNNCSLRRNDMVSLGAALKLTAVTHLELMCNYLEDDGVEMLAECLKETQIVKLDLRTNEISDKGAEALARVLKDTNLLHLYLGHNDIGDNGFSCLAEQISSTLVTIIDVGYNPLSRKSLFAIDSALWENRKIAHHLISSFKRIAPESNNNDFQFAGNTDSSDLNSLLEDCLFLYKTAVKQPSAVNVLAQEESLSFSKSQITTLFEEFPRQFALFVTTRIEADISQHVTLLKRTEELGLNSITELLILSRPVYMIDGNQGILHPYVYKLMHKYKQPIVNSAVEPGKKERIIEYFIEHQEFEDASDIVNLLRQSLIDTTMKESD